MTDFGRRFGPGELPSGDEAVDQSAADLATSLRMGRELEAIASREASSGSHDFADRVMTAIAAEPVPLPATALGSALRERRPSAALGAIRDAWRIVLGGGVRPLAVRAQALAIVLAVLVGVGSLGGATAIGAAVLLRPDVTLAPVIPSPSPEPEPSPSPTPDISPSPSPTPSETPEPTETAEPGETSGPTRSPEATRTLRPAETLKPGQTLKPGETLKPAETLEPDDDDTPEPTG